MNNVYPKDTIAAISTAMGSGAIGIIRLSGPKAWAIVQPIFQKRKPRPKPKTSEPSGTPPPSHRMVHGFIIDHRNTLIIDEVMIVYMQAPNSYTREDILEIQSHSGTAVLRKILCMVLEGGARMAEPGEFTRRAFLNGRIDLSQAESVAELINARTDSAMHSAALQVTGEMKEMVAVWIDTIKSMLAEIEARIEFEEDIENPIDRKWFLTQIHQKVVPSIEALIEEYQKNHVLRDGVRMDIVGRPNVGKSSILNRLIKKNKAIVTPIPGTTRDLIEENFSIRGIPITITDTAGLHESQDPVEIIGIQKTKENIAQANLVLGVVDASKGFVVEDLEILKAVGAKRMIIVLNKIDLDPGRKNRAIADKWSRRIVLEVSALTGEGMDKLKDAIAATCVEGNYLHPGETMIPSLRNFMLLQETHKSLKRFCEDLEGDIGEDLLAHELGRTLGFLQQITGELHNDQILDEIFSRFCIGK